MLKPILDDQVLSLGYWGLSLMQPGPAKKKTGHTSVFQQFKYSLNLIPEQDWHFEHDKNSAQT